MPQRAPQPLSLSLGKYTKSDARCALCETKRALGRSMPPASRTPVATPVKCQRVRGCNRHCAAMMCRTVSGAAVR